MGRRFNCLWRLQMAGGLPASPSCSINEQSANTSRKVRVAVVWPAALGPIYRSALMMARLLSSLELVDRKWRQVAQAAWPRRGDRRVAGRCAPFYLVVAMVLVSA